MKRLIVASAVAILAFLSGQKLYYVNLDSRFRIGSDQWDQYEIDKVKRMEFNSPMNIQKARNMGLGFAAFALLIVSILPSKTR